jgi:hypothetical protein
MHEIYLQWGIEVHIDTKNEMLADVQNGVHSPRFRDVGGESVLPPRTDIVG